MTVQSASIEDHAAVVAAWTKHHSSVVHYATTLLNGDVHAAEDVAQEATLRLWQHRDALTRPGSVRGWLLTVARNIIIDRSRRRATRPAEVAEPVESFESAHRVADPADEVVGRLVIHQLLGRISRPQREAVECVYLRGLSLNETATALDVPIGTVKSRCHNGLRALRDHAAAA
jgi:RNA polymerase sigma-70 factor (ECF subfamily)